ncbi:hypothetical protein WJX73_004598 [Symbiochloris irregularis]|uniref:PCI domain-containing protein n=1 Tax=Symbiochloris irregularis TaxID=706552 RepID=A0AAW1NSI2_9CHLO
MSVGEFTSSNIAASMDVDKDEGPGADSKECKELQAQISKQKQLAKEGRRTEAVEALLNLEKQHRLAENVTLTKACCLAVLDVLFEAQQWKDLNEHILLLAKRRSQLKQAVQAFVKQAVSYVDKAPDRETTVELIKTLQAVTEGKMYVEIERARLTRQLARIQEGEGKVAEAADTLQEIAVETFGAMAKTEKIDFILEQVRLCLERKDYVRAQILSRKVSPRAFVEQPGKKGQATGEVGIEGTAIEAPIEGTPTLEQLKLKYYELVTAYHAHQDDYLEMCRCYRAIYETPSIAEDPQKKAAVLRKICWYSVLAAASSDQATLLNTTAADKLLDDLPAYKELCKSFITQEVIWWKVFSEKYAQEIAGEEGVFGGDKGPKVQGELRARVTEHNILVVSKYYSRLKLERLGQLLDLPADETERQLSEMVVKTGLTARIDRPAGVVRFAAPKTPETVLNTWSRSIGKLLEVVDRTCQQIQKESMIHKIPIGAR